MFEKAAVILYSIIIGHPFHDGNKRTAMTACALFLDMNGFRLTLDDSAIDLSIAIAEGKRKFGDVLDWIESMAVRG